MFKTPSRDTKVGLDFIKEKKSIKLYTGNNCCRAKVPIFSNKMGCSRSSIYRICVEYGPLVTELLFTLSYIKWLKEPLAHKSSVKQVAGVHRDAQTYNISTPE